MLAGTKGVLDAMRIVVRYYASCTVCLPTRKVHNEYSSTCYRINEDVCERLQQNSCELSRNSI